MPFDEVLARCIADIEAGASIEECLARYPHHAANLEPLLRLMVQVQKTPKPTLSATGFARGRAAVAAQARYHQRLSESFLSQAPTTQTSKYISPTRPFVPPRAPTSLPPLLRWSSWMAAFLIVLTSITLGRTINTSTPGMVLYPIKLTGEQLQGYLFTAAGQEERWRIRQLERRLAELDQLARQGQDTTALLAVIDQEVQTALEASNGLSASERADFLADWLFNLQTAAGEPDHAATTVVTLGRVMATVEAAASAPVEPTVLPLLTTPTASPTATATASPTVPTATPLPTADEPTQWVQLPTVTPTESPVEESPTATEEIPITEPIPPTVAPTPAPIEEPDDDDDRNKDRPRPTDTPLPTVAISPTATLLPTATWTPILETATPTELPDVTITTEPTLDPTEQASTTPTEVTETPTVEPQTPTPTLDPSVTITPVETAPEEPTETVTPENPPTETVTPEETETATPETPNPSTPTPTVEELPTSEATPTETDDDDDDDGDEEDDPAADSTPTPMAVEPLRTPHPVPLISAIATRN